MIPERSLSVVQVPITSVTETQSLQWKFEILQQSYERQTAHAEHLNPMTIFSSLHLTSDPLVSQETLRSVWMGGTQPSQHALTFHRLLFSSKYF